MCAHSFPVAKQGLHVCTIPEDSDEHLVHGLIAVLSPAQLQVSPEAFRVPVAFLLIFLAMNSTESVYDHSDSTVGTNNLLKCSYVRVNKESSVSSRASGIYTLFSILPNEVVLCCTCQLDGGKGQGREIGSRGSMYIVHVQCRCKFTVHFYLISTYYCGI